MLSYEYFSDEKKVYQIATSSKLATTSTRHLHRVEQKVAATQKSLSVGKVCYLYLKASSLVQFENAQYDNCVEIKEEESDLKLSKELIDKILHNTPCHELINVNIVSKIKKCYENGQLDDDMDDNKFGVFVDKLIKIMKKNLN